MSLLQASLKAMQSIIVVAWPRVGHYGGEIMKSLIICWLRLNANEATVNGHDETRREIKRTFRLMQAVLPDSYIQECEGLAKYDKGLEGLLTM